MRTLTQHYLWTACEECTEYATEDKFTVDIEVYDGDLIVELTREDLESMLSALDALEGN